MKNPNQPAKDEAAELQTAKGPDLTPAARDVLNERARQQTVEGYSLADDDSHDEAELACAATWYALPEHLRKWFEASDIDLWPFEVSSFKPKNRRRDLVRSGALILAEIERLDRADTAAATTAQD